jgi:hypothetical protein
MPSLSSTFAGLLTASVVASAAVSAAVSAADIVAGDVSATGEDTVFQEQMTPRFDLNQP